MRTFKVPEMPKPTLICPSCGLHTLVNQGINMVCTYCGKKLKDEKKGLKEIMKNVFIVEVMTLF